MQYITFCMIIPCLELRRAPTLAYIRACTWRDLRAHVYAPLSLYIYSTPPISACLTPLQPTSYWLRKKKNSWNSHFLNQNVNGDMSMNTDGVQPQFKRSQQSVNIHAISGITARDVCVLFKGQFGISRKLSRWKISGNMSTKWPPYKDIRTRGLLSRFNFVPSRSAESSCAQWSGLDNGCGKRADGQITHFEWVMKDQGLLLTDSG